MASKLSPSESPPSHKRGAPSHGIFLLVSGVYSGALGLLLLVFASFAGLDLDTAIFVGVVLMGPLAIAAVLALTPFARKSFPLLAAALTGALVALATNLIGLSDHATMFVGALVLVPVVAIGTPLAFRVDPLGLLHVRRPPVED